MRQDVTGQNSRYLPIIKNLGCRSTGKCKQVIVKLIIPQSKKCVILGVKVCKEKLAPLICKSSSRIGHEAVKIHNKENWFKRFSITALDNSVGLGMAMLAGNFVQNQVEVQEFSNLWGLLATRPIVSESTYQVLSFTAEFFIALIVFTLTEHFLDEYRQRKKITETSCISENRESIEVSHPNMPEVKAASDEV